MHPSITSPPKAPKDGEEQGQGVPGEGGSGRSQPIQGRGLGEVRKWSRKPACRRASNESGQSRMAWRVLSSPLPQRGQEKEERPASQRRDSMGRASRPQRQPKDCTFGTVGSFTSIFQKREEGAGGVGGR
ncbi:hypothetical protein V6N13_109480 [Hibiscus sabdariffa]